MADTSHSVVQLHEIAHSREGDKGNWATISLIAYSPRLYDTIVEQVTAQVVHSAFAHRGARHVDRYEMPKVHALNFVIHDVLEGGVNGSLCLDGHGKSMSFHLLSLPIRIPADWIDTLAADRSPT